MTRFKIISLADEPRQADALGAPANRAVAEELGTAQEATTLTSRSDDDLMLLARGGVERAFDELVRRYQAPALRMARQQLGSDNAAHDAAQDCFLDIYKALDRYQPRGTFRAYLYRVLLNRCRMARRKARYESLMRRELRFAGTDNVPQAEEFILAREQRRQLEGAVARLPRRQRDAVVLRLAAGLSYQQIAQVLGVPMGTVKRRLFEGLHRLHSLLGQADS